MTAWAGEHIATSARGTLSAVVGFRRLPVIVIVSFVILAAIAFVAIFSGFVSPYGPTDVDFTALFQKPVFLGGSADHPLGTDQLGRDVLSRAFHGASLSFRIAVVAVLAGGVFGTLIGLVAGFSHHLVDDALMRLTDVQLAMPFILLALGIIAALGPSVRNVIIVLAITSWVPYARITRAETLSLRQRDFVDLARVAGVGRFGIIFRHILPNTIPSTLVLLTLNLPQAILLEATLSFLGVGVQLPEPSWGNMIAEGREFMPAQWWISTMPSLMLVLTIFAANIVGDWIRDRIDPNLQIS